MVEPYNYAYGNTVDNRCSFLLLCADHDLKCHESTIYNVVSKMIICIPRSAHVCHILEPSFHLQPQLQWHLRCCCLYAGWSSESEPDPSETKVSLAIYVSLFYFMNGMGLRMDNSISPCFFGFWRGGVGQAIINNHFLGYICWSVPANSNQLQCRMFICIIPWSAWVCPRSESEKWFYPASGKSLPSLSLQTLK